MCLDEVLVGFVVRRDVRLVQQTVVFVRMSKDWKDAILTTTRKKK